MGRCVVGGEDVLSLASTWSLGTVPRGPSLVWRTTCCVPGGAVAIEKSIAWRFTSVIV